MRLLALAGDADALIADIRLRTPLAELCRQTGWSLVLKSFHDCRRSDFESADMMIVQRGASARVWRLQHAMRLRGGAVVYEIDDLLTELPSHISNHAAMAARVPWVRRCLAECDAVTVSTQRLGEALGLARFCVAPNHAMPLGDAPMPALAAAQPVSLLFASMERLATDFIYGPLRALSATHGAGLQIVVMGPPGAAFEAAGLRVQRHPLMPRAGFIAFARSLPNPLAVIPLEDSRFAACKSAIKWFEYAEAGLPVLCSDVSPYRDVVRDGVDGRLVANDAAAWQQALQQAIVDGAWRQRIAVAARAEVRAHHTLAQSAQAWQRAIVAAREQAQARGALQPTLAWALRDRCAGWFEAATLRLRERNRARLARRQQR